MLSFLKNGDVTQTLGVFAFALLLCNVIYNFIRSRSYPPGPFGLPFLGYGFFLGKKAPAKLIKLGEVYGPIFSFYMGSQLIICVNDFHVIKEILNHPNTLARPPHAYELMIKGGIGVLNGEQWTEQRRFIMQTLRNLGFGKGRWEKMIQEAAYDNLIEIKKMEGKPVFFEKVLSRSIILNNVSLLFGRRLDVESEKEEIELIENLAVQMRKFVGSTAIPVTLPWLLKVLKIFNFKNIGDFITLTKKIGAVIEKEIANRLHAENATTKDDFIGYYLSEMEKRKNAETNHSFTVKNLEGSMFSLFMAGHTSLSSNVCWLLLQMAKNQVIQKRICDEIDSVFGRDGTIYFEDKQKLPYTTAAILESLRWSATSLFPPRYVTESFTFKNYEIPRDSFIISNAYAMMHDSSFFKNPMEYNPEKFIDDNGKTKLTNVDGYGPFSFGKRNCPAENISLMTIYLYFVTIMQKFTIKSSNATGDDLEGKLDSADLVPFQWALHFIER